MAVGWPRRGNCASSSDDSAIATSIAGTAMIATTGRRSVMSHGRTARATPDEMAINTAAVVERLPASRSPGTAPPRIVPRHQIKAANTIAMRSAPVSCPPVREPIQVVGFGIPGERQGDSRTIRRLKRWRQGSPLRQGVCGKVGHRCCQAVIVVGAQLCVLPMPVRELRR